MTQIERVMDKLIHDKQQLETQLAECQKSKHEALGQLSRQLEQVKQRATEAERKLKRFIDGGGFT